MSCTTLDLTHSVPSFITKEMNSRKLALKPSWGFKHSLLLYPLMFWFVIWFCRKFLKKKTKNNFILTVKLLHTTFAVLCAGWLTSTTLSTSVFTQTCIAVKGLVWTGQFTLQSELGLTVMHFKLHHHFYTLHSFCYRKVEVRVGK